MGSGESVPRRVTFEADENDNVTVVKGVRLSENVIERMKEPYSPGGKPQQKLGSHDHTSFGGAAVSEEELRKRIADELALEQARRDTEAHKRLKQNQKYLQDDILERERTASNEQLARAILRERTAAEDERMKAQLLAKQLEVKEREQKKQDAYYKEQLARLEERSSQFYQVTTEQYQKAVDAVGARFKFSTESFSDIRAFFEGELTKAEFRNLSQLVTHLPPKPTSDRRFKSKPVCADLQGKIFECYQQNPQETLSCSTLASEYLKCVHHSRQGTAGRGG